MPDFDPATQYYFAEDRIVPAVHLGDLILAEDTAPERPSEAFVIRQVVPHADGLGASLPTVHMSIETRERLCDELLQYGGEGNELAGVGKLETTEEQRMKMFERCERYSGADQIYTDGKALLADFDKVSYRVVRLRRIAREQRERAEAEAKAANDFAVRIAQLERELAAAKGLRDTPQTADFASAVALEADHQVARWGVQHDAGKAHADWFWLLGYLAGKALHAACAGEHEKALHHTISAAAALLNWHRALSGQPTTMRPGIDPPDDLFVQPQSLHENLAVVGIVVDGKAMDAPYPMPATHFDGSGGAPRFSVQRCIRVTVLSTYPHPLLINLQLRNAEHRMMATYGQVIQPGSECTLTYEPTEPLMSDVEFQINAIDNFEMKSADGQEDA